MAQEGTRRGARGPAISLTAAPETVQLNPGDRAEVRLVVEATDPNAPPTRYHLDVTGLQRRWYTLGETDILTRSGRARDDLARPPPRAGQSVPRPLPLPREGDLAG